jgi:hypothetical protein
MIVIPHVVSVSFSNLLPIRLYRAPAGEKDLEEFNSGKFVRDNYRYVYELAVETGKNRPTHFLVTPSLSLALRAIPRLLFIKEGEEFDRLGHPAVLRSFDFQKEVE